MRNNSTVGGDVAGGLWQLGAQSLVLRGAQALEPMKAMNALPVEAVRPGLACPWGRRRVSL